MLNRYIIERKISGVGKSSEEDFSKMAGKSNEALAKLGSQGTNVQWVQSFVTGDKVYCEYLAPNEDTIKEHARLAGLPADSILKVEHVCDPTTSNEFDYLKSGKAAEASKTFHA